MREIFKVIVPPVVIDDQGAGWKNYETKGLCSREASLVGGKFVWGALFERGKFEGKEASLRKRGFIQGAPVGGAGQLLLSF